MPSSSPMTAEILLLAQNYKKATGTSITRLGEIVMGDGKFFSHLKKGSDCNTATYHRVIKWFEKNMPKLPRGDNAAEVRA
jgi:hypothetical protein